MNSEIINEVPNGQISPENIEKYYENSQYINGILYNNENKSNLQIESPLESLTKKYFRDPYSYENEEYLFTKT